MAETVKEFVKSDFGLGRWSNRLQIGSLAPGSVQVVLRAPRGPTGTSNEPTMAGTDAPSVESRALEHVVALMLMAQRAEDRVEDVPLDAALQDLRGGARTALSRMSRGIAEAGWSITGQLVSSAHGTTPMQFSAGAAGRLARATSVTDAEVTTEPLRARVDGWTWSEATMVFEPLDRA